MKVTAHFADENILWYKHFIKCHLIEADFNDYSPEHGAVVIQPTVEVLKSGVDVAIFYDLNSIDPQHMPKTVHVYKQSQVDYLKRQGVDSHLIPVEKLRIVDTEEETISALDIPLRFMHEGLMKMMRELSTNVTYMGSKNCQHMPYKYRYLIQMLDIPTVTDWSNVPINIKCLETLRKIKEYYYYENPLYFNLAKEFFKNSYEIQ